MTQSKSEEQRMPEAGATRRMVGPTNGHFYGKEHDENALCCQPPECRLVEPPTPRRMRGNPKCSTNHGAFHAVEHDEIGTCGFALACQPVAPSSTLTTTPSVAQQSCNLAPIDVESLRAQHPRATLDVEGEDVDVCDVCQVDWPCDAVTALDALSDAVAERDRLTDYARRLRETALAVGTFFNGNDDAGWERRCNECNRRWDVGEHDANCGGLVLRDLLAEHGGSRASEATTATGDVLHEIATERARQITDGYTADHDDAHVGGELAMAGAFYAIASNYWLDEHEPDLWKEVHRLWPWVEDEPSHPADRRDGLVTAAALIVAEIERLHRAASREPQ